MIDRIARLLALRFKDRWTTWACPDPVLSPEQILYRPISVLDVTASRVVKVTQRGGQPARGVWIEMGKRSRKPAPDHIGKILNIIEDGCTSGGRGKRQSM